MSNPYFFLYTVLISVDDITRDSVAIVFEIPQYITQETYTVVYGNESTNLNQVSEPMESTNGTSAYTITIDGLSTATIYYFQIVATYDVVYNRYSDLSLFRTREDGKIIYINSQ